MEPDISASLEEQVGELRSRVCRMEEALQNRGIVLLQADAGRATEGTATSPAKPSDSLSAPELPQNSIPRAIAETPFTRPLFSFSAPSTRLDKGEFVRRIYKRENVIHAWSKSHHAVYLVFPEGANLPENKYGHW